MTKIKDAYGYVNGKAVYSHDEFIFEKRHFGAIENDEDLLRFAEKVTHGWYQSGWKQNFIGFYISNYCMDEPCNSLTKKELDRLKELQAEARAENKRLEDAKQWRLIDTVYWADNSVEEIYEDKDGNRKQVMVIAPHGDVC